MKTRITWLIFGILLYIFGLWLGDLAKPVMGEEAGLFSVGLVFPAVVVILYGICAKSPKKIVPLLKDVFNIF